MTATVTSLPVWPASVPVHPAAELFPLMSGSDFDELVKDIRTNGLVTPIVRTPDGLILDGRNRYRACLAADVRPVYEVHDGEPWRFVISTNLHRRHLTDSQRAMVAAKIAERAVGRPKMSSDDGISREAIPTRTEAAHMLSVSPSQVDRARVVEKRGTENLKTAVETGAVPVSTAARVANELTPAEQNDFVEKVNAGANPRQIAPPAEVPPSRAGRTDRSYYKSERKNLSRTAVEKVIHMAGGLTLGLAEASALDESITSEEAARWMDDLSDGIKSLRRLHNLLKERTS